jgi:hypothetical protein
LHGDRRTWTALRINGRTKRMALGDVRRIDLDAARTAARKFFAESTLGKDPVKERAEAGAKAANTFGSVVEKYLPARKSKVRLNTYRHLDRYLRRYFKPLHSMPITRSNIQTIPTRTHSLENAASGGHCALGGA